MGLNDKTIHEEDFKHSKSYPEKKRTEDDQVSRLSLRNGFVKQENKLAPDVVKLQSSVTQEIVELEKTLQNQFDVRKDLERALGYTKSSQDNSIFTPKPATGLIKEVAVLELEVLNLEKYLLSLYRKAFNKQASVYESPSLKQHSSISPKSTLTSKCDFSRQHEPPKHENWRIESRCFAFNNRFKDPYSKENDIDSSVTRCQSLLNQQSIFCKRISLPEESIKEYIDEKSSIGTPISSQIPKLTPNKLSEEMIKFASTMYCKFSDTRSLPSRSKLWSSSFRKNSDFDEKVKASGPYRSMIEVSYIKRTGHDFELMLGHFRLLLKQLEDVDLRKLTYEEKLAFWINVHNSLVMHTFLVNGIPKKNGKRFLLLSKRAYNIGGRVMSIEILQNSILFSRMPRPKQWLRLLRTSKNLRTEYLEYSLEHSEPLVYFALCFGSHSDPAIRLYTPQSIYLELETAKEEYILARIGFKNDQKVILPRNIKSFSKESCLNQVELMEMIQECLPEHMKKTIRNFNIDRSRKRVVEWIPHRFGFRYLIAKELII